VNVFHISLIPDFQGKVVLRPEIESGISENSGQIMIRGRKEVKTGSETGDKSGDFIN